jgi:hypothetical protein
MDYKCSFRAAAPVRLWHPRLLLMPYYLYTDSLAFHFPVLLMHRLCPRPLRGQGWREGGGIFEKKCFQQSRFFHAEDTGRHHYPRVTSAHTFIPGCRRPLDHPHRFLDGLPCILPLDPAGFLQGAESPQAPGDTAWAPHSPADTEPLYGHLQSETHYFFARSMRSFSSCWV